MAEDDTQTTSIRPTRGSGKTAHSPDSPAGGENFWSNSLSKILRCLGCTLTDGTRISGGRS